MSAAGSGVCIACRSAVQLPVAGSSSTIAAALSGAAARSTTRSPSTTTELISVNGTSISRMAPGSGPTRYSRSRPRDRATATIDPSAANP